MGKLRRISRKVLGFDSWLSLYIIRNNFTSYLKLPIVYRKSTSQIAQDIFVISSLKLLKRKSSTGFFVEIGAADGVEYSNTFLLETKFKWRGIVIEPGKNWRESLFKNRQCFKDFRCITSESGKTVKFHESRNGMFSTIENYVNSDSHGELRSNGVSYQVETISLNELLHQFNSPINIDYISIDTEGSELEILSTFDFSYWNVSIFTIEHNYNANRQKIRDLMIKNGFELVLEGVTFMDDWFVKKTLVQKWMKL